MFRKSENQSVDASRSTHSSSRCTTASVKSTSANNSYPPLDENNKRFSVRRGSSGVDKDDKKTNNDVFHDEESPMHQTGSSQQDDRFMKALAAQAYHLPGYTYWQDWRQYFTNNHPMFGICFHHPSHPIGWGMRALCFVASVVFGLVLTNIVWLWAESLEDNSAVFAVDVGDQAQRSVNVTQYIVDINEENQIEVTKDMIVLWTLGGALHGFFDNTIWTLTLCSFCDPGGKYEHLQKYKRFGVGLLSFFVLAIAAIATLSVVLRAALETSDEELQFNELRSAGLMDDAVDFSGQNRESYEFLMSYGVELAIALLFHFPVIGFILFSGCLNIRGKLPIFGGRPYEVMREEEELDGTKGTSLGNDTNSMGGRSKFNAKQQQQQQQQRRGSTGSNVSSQPLRGSTGGETSQSPLIGFQPRRGSAASNISGQQRRGSAGSTSHTQASPGSTSPSTGARDYSGARIYIPQNSTASGRVVPGQGRGPQIPPKRPRGRPNGTPPNSLPSSGGKK